MSSMSDLLSSGNWQARLASSVKVNRYFPITPHALSVLQIEMAVNIKRFINNRHRRSLDLAIHASDIFADDTQK